MAERLGQNIKALREMRGLTQQQIAKLADLPRATWSNLESGAANPTLSVLDRVATVFQITLEELVSVRRTNARKYEKGTLPIRKRGEVTVSKLLPDPLPGMEIDRLDLPPKSKMIGVPHTPGTREYLACETGELRLIASGEAWTLSPGDVVAFDGNQKHSYENIGPKRAIGYSVVVLARVQQ